MVHNAHAIGKERKVWLMIWDANPDKNDKPQKIKVNSKVVLNEGDLIKTSDTAENQIFYEILNIDAKRPSSINGMDYYTLTAKRTKGFRE